MSKPNAPTLVAGEAEVTEMPQGDTASVADAPQIAKDAPELPPVVSQAPELAPLKEGDAFKDIERSPSDWSIEPDVGAGAEAILATNSRTNRVFKGTVAEFNQRMRG